MERLRLISRDFGNSRARKLDYYRAHGGYQAALKALDEMAPRRITEEVIKSNLRGLGGAGFPVGRKWSFVPSNTGKPIYLVVNADEGEPGTFKDRYIMEWDPHRLLEGMIICARAVGIHTAYIYIRGEYVHPERILREAIEEAYREGILGSRVLGRDFSLDVHMHVGAGAYICGEETGLLESLEGKKGWPRLKPPFPAVVGAFGCPTVINNVESLTYLPHIVANGGEWFANLGSERNGGLRLFSLSGDVKRPGVYELPMGTPLRELIYGCGGGMADGKQLKAVIPGGSSAAVLTADEIDVPLDFDHLARIGSMLGSAGIVVMAEDVCMVEAMRVISHFYAHESCGQCTPCREGTGWVARTVDAIHSGRARRRSVEDLMQIADNMSGTSICALCDGAAMPLRSFLVKFRGEFDYHLKHGRCDLKRPVPAVARSGVFQAPTGSGGIPGAGQE